MAPTKEEQTEVKPEESSATPEVEVEKTEEPEGSESDLSESEQDEAKRLYAALRDPRQAAPLIAALAQNAGLNLAPNPTKAEIKSETKSILEIVKSSLGEEYKFLADRLSSAIEGALAEHSKTQEAKFAELAQSQIESQVERAYEVLARETKGESKRLERRMSELADEMPIGNQDVQSYIRRLYAVANAEGVRSSARQTADKIRRNASDAPARIANRGSATAAEPEPVPQKKMSLREAVDFAYQQQLKK